jgi:hypothetical protein
MKNIALISLFFLLFFPSWTHAEDLNAGFVQGLWYSSDVVFANTPTRIYVAFRNNTPNDLTGTIRFTDNDKRIGSSNVSALSGRLVEAWVDWNPTYGEHKLVVTLSNAEVHIIGEGSKPATLADVTVEETLTVDYDTDKDGVGNNTDTDDDNDEVSDTDEKTRGSDPLVPNPKPVPSDQKTEDEKQKEVTETKSKEESITDATPHAGERGLEKFLPEGTADTLLTNVTNKVTDAKQSLDAYRSERNKTEDKTTVEETVGSSSIITSGVSFDTATITRSQIEPKPKESLLSSFVTSIATIFHKIGTFVLWILSSALAYPALMQILLLFLILYIIYRLIRRVGRRPY